MCGRYQRRSDKQKIAEAFHLGDVDGLALEIAPDYNVAPQTMQPVVIWDDQFGTRTMHMMFWRFLPPFVADPKKFTLSTINAHSAKLTESGMWRDSFLKRRCLIPADSFVEWHREGKNRKLPFLFAMKDEEPFGLGGVWRRWRSPDRKTVMDTFAIITVEPNELVMEKTGHDRMPLIIERRNWQRWLEPGSEEQPPVDLLRPFESSRIKAWRVDQRINSVSNNDPTLVEPLKEEPPKEEPPKEMGDGQLGLFGNSV